MFLVPDTEMVAIIGEPVVFTPAVKLEIFPEPEAAKLIDGVSFVQLKVTPPVPMFDPKTVAGTVPPEHTMRLIGAVTIGVGLTVNVKV